MPLRRIAASGALAALGLSSTISPAQAAPRPVSQLAPGATCPAQRGTIKRVGSDRIWLRGGTLWGCAVVGENHRTTKLGPTTPEWVYSFHGPSVAWTTQTVADSGDATDHVWAANLQTGSVWLKGVAPTPGSTGGPKPGVVVDDDALVVRIKATGAAVAWVTAAGALVMSVESPTSAAPDPYPAASTSPPGGLLQPFKVTGRRALLGRWPGLNADFPLTLKIEQEEGEGDECGGSNGWIATVRPAKGQPRIGGEWWSSYGDIYGICS